MEPIYAGFKPVLEQHVHGYVVWQIFFKSENFRYIVLQQFVEKKTHKRLQFNFLEKNFL